MNDIEIAVDKLGDSSVCFCKDGEFFALSGRGISPLIRMIDEGRDLRGYSAADIIVGKAAAMLFAKMGVIAVYGRLMSESGRDFLDSAGIPSSYGVLTDKIINRTGDDICPMEKAAADISDPEEAYHILKARSLELRKGAIDG